MVINRKFTIERRSTTIDFCLKNCIISETKWGDDFVHKNSIITCVYGWIKTTGHDEVYIIGDFLELGEYHAIGRALLRLEETGNIQNHARGLLYYPLYSKLIDKFEVPSPNNVAELLTRKFSWTIAPCGDTALNQLGLSTQVPAKWSYISDGAHHEFQIRIIIIEFKHRSNREISGISRQTAPLFRLWKWLEGRMSKKRISSIIRCTCQIQEKSAY